MKRRIEELGRLVLVWTGIACAMPSVGLGDDLGDRWGTERAEAAYYQIVDVPIPEGLALEAGSFVWLPDGRLAIGTRRGEIFLVDGIDERFPQPEYQRYAAGMDEILGLDFRDGAFYVTQQTELTRVTDANGDGRADRFVTLSDDWGFNAYHEFAIGSKLDRDGATWIALCLSKSYQSDRLFRGWALKVDLDGTVTPVASGIRSPLGVGLNESGVMFYAESQGPWNGSCSLKHLKPGGFMGHPASFVWYPEAPNMGAAPTVPDTPSRLEIERERVPELVPYSVVFPYIKMGRSISGFEIDRTGGDFGPFADQIFIGDFTMSVVMRATTEEVNGVWQGACYPFREGLGTGILNVTFTPEGRLLTGGTNRGWPVRGSRRIALERLDWTGKTPFEIRDMRVTTSGFVLRFTKPVDKGVALSVENYDLETYTHIYRQGYGSPEVDQTFPTVTAVRVADDGMSLAMDLSTMTQGHVHELSIAGLRSADGEAPLHSKAYYTLNEIPKADRSAP